MAKRPGQPRAELRLVRSFGASVSRPYRSGRRSNRETPETRSILSTRSAGTCPLAIQPEMLPCDLSPRARARAVCPPTFLQASNNALLLMPSINAQTVYSVNGQTGKWPAKNGRMSRTPTYPPSEFWKRLEEAIGKNYENFNANALATRLEMSQGTVHRWYRGIGFPELELAIRLARQGGVCVEWLLTGAKPKHPISKDPLLRELFAICEQLQPGGRMSTLKHARGELLQQKEELANEENQNHSGPRRIGSG